MARDYKPDLVLMDIYMPVMDGLKATIEIRKDPELKNTPIVGLSAGVTVSEKRKAKEAGMDNYLIKPF